MPLIQQRWVAFKGSSIRLIKGPDGLWRDDDGTVWAYAEGGQADTSDNCGVGVFSLPNGNPLNHVCRFHDFQYSSPGFQAFHTREESDAYLESLIEQDKTAGAWRLLAKPFYFLCRLFGGPLWENDKTR